MDHLGALIEEEPDLAQFFCNYKDKVKHERQSRALEMAKLAERKRHEEVLRQSEERLRLALLAARMGTWDWNIQTGEVIWSDKLASLFGLNPGEFEGTYVAFLRCVHPRGQGERF